ncbi:MAG: ABC transporter permease [Deltaproteobacteria bacterium]|nr:ABC transporter permease [Deltaproteobacteria bacterium]MBW2444692.1 ABC transporter permease [Deltaproteobacteria bacterium]
MSRVGFALALHELSERIRDRWVLLGSVLFALMASGVSLYGRMAEADLNALTGPSLVTLTALLVPLVAMVLSHDAIVGERDRNTLGLLLSLPVSRMEVVAAKYVGRSIALALSVIVGLGAAMGVSGPAGVHTLLALMGPTLLLGLAFLSLGMLISTCARRQVTAASVVVMTWFLLVFFYDLALLGILVISDGAVSQQTISSLVLMNPAGLYRLQMMQVFAGPEVLRSLGMTVALPGLGTVCLLWTAWLVLPTAVSGILLTREKVTG